MYLTAWYHYFIFLHYNTTHLTVYLTAWQHYITSLNSTPHHCINTHVQPNAMDLHILAHLLSAIYTLCNLLLGLLF